MPESDPETELIAAIEEWAPGLAGTLNAETPLFESGQLDSLGLLNLVTWIEDRIGVPVDVASLDPARQWSNVAAILHYIEQRKR